MGKNFDLVTHHRNKKTGRVERVTPYRLHISKQGMQFERDGVRYHPNGDIIDPPKPASKPEFKAEPIKEEVKDVKSEARPVSIRRKSDAKS